MKTFRDISLFIARLPVQSIGRLAAVLVLSAISFTATLHAVAITYKLVVHARGIGIPSGTLGAVSFGGSNGDAVLTFIFEGDTANVVPFSIPSAGSAPAATGFVNFIGTASVQVTDSQTPPNALAQGVFLPAAGIYVSVDKGRGVGFGSFGTLVSSSGIPGQPLYPYAVDDFVGTSNIDGYDLQHDLLPGITDPAVSCFDFGDPLFPQCADPKPLPLVGGDMLLVDTELCFCVTATFSAETHAGSAVFGVQRGGGDQRRPVRARRQFHARLRQQRDQSDG